MVKVDTRPGDEELDAQQVGRGAVVAAVPFQEDPFQQLDFRPRSAALESGELDFVEAGAEETEFDGQMLVSEIVAECLDGWGEAWRHIVGVDVGLVFHLRIQEHFERLRHFAGFDCFAQAVFVGAECGG